MAEQIITGLQTSFYTRTTYLFKDIDVVGQFLFYINTPYNDILGFNETAILFNLTILNNALPVTNIISGKRLIPDQDYFKPFKYLGFSKLQLSGNLPTISNIDNTSILYYGD